MTPQDMIDRYVQEVARRLPQAVRGDVAAELRSLIADGLSERAAGQTPSEAQAADFLKSLGSPASFALRYCAPAPVIDPADTLWFNKLSIGVLIALAVLGVGMIAAAPHTDEASWRAAANIITSNFIDSALKLLGLILIAFWCTAALRRRLSDASTWNPRALPPVRDPDHVSRLGMSAAIVAWIMGFLMLMHPAAAFDLILGRHAPPALQQALAYDASFTQARAPVLWFTVAASLLLIAWATIEGRWRKLTRQVALGVSTIFCLVSAWVVVSGPIFAMPAADQTMKFALATIASLTAIDIWRQVRGDTPMKMDMSLSVL